jgi:hypothetical protein
VGRVRSTIRSLGPEPFLWLFGLLFLAFLDPASPGHFTVCPFRIVGFAHCPGCGLGRSVSFLLHGDPIRSLQSHVLGIPATMVLLFRIIGIIVSVRKRTTTNRSAYA